MSFNWDGGLQAAHGSPEYWALVALYVAVKGLPLALFSYVFISAFTRTWKS